MRLYGNDETDSRTLATMIYARRQRLDQLQQSAVQIINERSIKINL